MSLLTAMKLSPHHSQAFGIVPGRELLHSFEQYVLPFTPTNASPQMAQVWL